jgi:hypothetical protein
MRKFQWKSLAVCGLMTASLAFPVQAAPEVPEKSVDLFSAPLSLSLSEKIELAQLDKRRQETLSEMKRDPARAFLLSALYPGLGQLYVGNDNPRSFWIMGGGTLLLAGGLTGFALLADRPQEASSLGNLLITLSLLGYHLWNIRDAYFVATDYNHMLENKYRISDLLAPISLSASLDHTPVLSYQFTL